jgi:hypothetical protein
MFDERFHEIYMYSNKRHANTRPPRVDEYEEKSLQAEYSAEESGKGARRPLKF